MAAEGGEMKRGIWILIAVSLAANAALGVIVFNHYRWLEEVEADVDAVETQSRQDHLEQLSRVHDLTAEVAEVRSSNFNPAGLEQQIADLRSQVRFLEGTDNDLFQLLVELAGVGSPDGGALTPPDVSIDPSAIEKPIGCYGGMQSSGTRLAGSTARG
jgi:hypothetical protein